MILISSTERLWRHMAMRPEQAKQIIRCKGILTIEAAAISLRESPTFLSTTLVTAS